MVKVLNCHSFRSQQIVRIKKEPICLSSGQDTLFIGTNVSTVVVFKQDKDGFWPEYCNFQTGAAVSQIEYNETGDYVSTIEKKVSRRSEVVSVKVYLNWNIAHNNTTYRTRVRVASLGYRSTNVDTGKRLEVVDIPCEKPAQHLTTCQQTGNLGIVCSSSVKLYHLVEKTIPHSQTTFLDVILFLELQFGYLVTRLSLCEDFVTCSSADFVQVFKLVISNDDLRTTRSSSNSGDLDGVSPTRLGRRNSSVVSSSLSRQQNKFSIPKSSKVHHQNTSVNREKLRFSIVGDRSSATPSPALSLSSKVTNSLVEDDADYVHWDFPTTMTTLSMKTPSVSSSNSNHVKSSTPNDPNLHLKGLESLGQEDRPEPPLPFLRDLRGGAHLTTGKTTLIQVMHKYLGQSDHSWIYLQLIPTYLTGKQERLDVMESPIPVYSTRHSSLIDMSCLMSGTRTGYVYSLLSDVSLLSTYKYSTDAIQIQTNGHLVYVLVKTGLETYTARCRIAAIYNNQHFDNINQACPPTTIDICMCGFQTFVGGPRAITLADRNVILLNKMLDHENENVWNVYVLEDSSPADLYFEMVSFGTKYQKNAADTYHHLLQEGHMILKSNLIGQSLNQSEVSILQDLLNESCALLGEYYATSNCEDWHLCLPYYLMSGLSTIDVVRQSLQYKQHSKQDSPARYGQGLVQYLKYILFQDEDPFDIKQSDCDLMLDVCFEIMPEKLADIVLLSRLKSYTPEKALSFLQGSVKHRAGVDSKSKTKDILAMVMLKLQLCEPDAAFSLLDTIEKNDLIEACVTNQQIMHSGLLEFSPLSQLLRCKCPDVLIHVLVSLYDRGTIPMDLALRLLQGRSGVLEIHRNTHIRDYLEALINDAGRKVCFEEAVSQLCEIYLLRLSEWEPPSIRQVTASMKFRLPKGSGHFGRRHGWLDHMPPFSGSQSISVTCRHVVPAGGRRTGKQSQLLQCQKTEEICSCFMCNEDLLKLQSVLCSHDTTEVLCEKVLSLLDKHPTTSFYDSLYILCMAKIDTKEAIKKLIDNHPGVVAEFAGCVIKHNWEQWEFLLKYLLDRLRPLLSCSEDDNNRTKYYKALTDVLREMASYLSTDTFLRVLPGDGNFFFFMPYIKLCMDNKISAGLKDNILVLGEKLICEVTA